MKKDINTILLGLVVFLLISIVVLTLYYQETYRNLDRNYREATNKLNKAVSEVKIKSEELNKREKELIDIINELNISKQRISSLSDYYESLKGEKEILENRLKTMESDRDKYKLNLDEKIQELKVCEKDKKLFSDELNNANAKISKAGGKVGNMSKIVHSMETNLDDMESIIDKIPDYLDDIEEDLNNCNCTSNKMDNLNDSINELDEKISKSRNLLYIINTIIKKLTDILK